MDGTDDFGSQGTAAAQRAPSTVPAAPIWRVTAPPDGSALGGRRHLFPAGRAPAANLTRSANWAAPAEGTSAPDDGRTPQSEPPAPRPSEAAGTPAPSGYSVQVGAFRNPANASAQAARLSAAGYSPQIVHAKATQSRLYMVRLGAFPDRPTAQTFARQIADRLDIDTWPVAN
jgi:cell division septation protein DedD